MGLNTRSVSRPAGAKQVVVYEQKCQEVGNENLKANVFGCRRAQPLESILLVRVPRKATKFPLSLEWSAAHQLVKLSWSFARQLSERYV
jgi:hypothetical protein